MAKRGRRAGVLEEHSRTKRKPIERYEGVIKPTDMSQGKGQKEWEGTPGGSNQPWAWTAMHAREAKEKRKKTWVYGPRSNNHDNTGKNTRTLEREEGVQLARAGGAGMGKGGKRTPGDP